MPNLNKPLISEKKFLKKVIDVRRYPILDVEADSYKELVFQCREKLNEDGYCLLNGFIESAALEQMLKEACELLPGAFHKTLTGNAYLAEIDQNLREDDVRRMIDTTSLAAVASDRIPREHSIKRLYKTDILLNFIKDCLSYEHLYRYADPMSELNLAVMKEGDYLRWHFDQTDFVVSIMIDNCIAGGEYQVVPGIRDKDNENFKKVKDVLNGSTEGVLTLNIEPGCLVLFQGKYSLHRVTKVEGEKPRIVSLLAYDVKPNTYSSDYLKMIRYGRVS